MVFLPQTFQFRRAQMLVLYCSKVRATIGSKQFRINSRWRLNYSFPFWSRYFLKSKITANEKYYCFR